MTIMSEQRSLPPSTPAWDFDGDIDVIVRN